MNPNELAKMTDPRLPRFGPDLNPASPKYHGFCPSPGARRQWADLGTILRHSEPHTLFFEDDFAPLSLRAACSSRVVKSHREQIHVPCV
jgi:hypothetical protein